MKKLILLLSVFAAVACQNEPLDQTKIIGTWETVDFKANVSGLSKEMLESGKKMAMEINFEITEGTWKEMKDGRSTGEYSWKWNDKGDAIIARSKDPNFAWDDTYKIQTLNDSILVWSMTSEYGGNTRKMKRVN